MMQKSELQSLALTLVIGWAVMAVLFPISALWSGQYAIGEPTRDLYDHLFLLDQWTTLAEGWNFPDGGRLMPPDLSGMLFAAPWFGLGRVMAYNMALLTQWTLMIWAGWLLGNRFGSGLLGGLAMGFSPIFLSQLCSGEGETVSAWTIPLFLYMLVTPHGQWAWRVGLTASLAGLLSWYFGLYVGLIMVVYVLWNSRFWTAQVDWSVCRPLWICGLSIAPFALWYGSILGSDAELFRGLSMSEYMRAHPRALASFSADPVAWFLGSHFASAHSDFLGWIPLLLMGWGARSFYRKEKRLALVFGIIAACAALLSLGPVLHLRGNPVFEYMPYRALMALPVVDFMRLPHRWMLVVIAAIIPFIAVAGRRLSPIFAIFILGEVFWFSAPQRTMTAIKAPEIIQLYEGPVLDLPARTMGPDARGQYLIWQREHGQAIPYSLLMTAWSSLVANEPLVHWVAAQDSKDPIEERIVEAEQFRQGDFATAVSNATPEAIIGVRERLKTAGLWAVVLHLQLLKPEDATVIQRQIELQLGTPTHESNEAVLWEL